MTSNQASDGLKYEYYHLQARQGDQFYLTRPSTYSALFPYRRIYVFHIVVADNWELMHLFAFKKSAII